MAVLNLRESSLPGDVMRLEANPADITDRMAHIIRSRNMDVRALIDDFRQRDIDTRSPIRHRAFVDVDTFRRGMCYAFGEQWMRLRMSTEEFERICATYGKPAEIRAGHRGAPLVRWMEWAEDLQKVADEPPAVIDMDAADDAELDHWLKGTHMDMGSEGPVSDKEVVLAQVLLRESVSKRFSELSRCFRLLDEDKSGKLSRREMLRILMIFNLHTTPARVFDRLMEFCDQTADGVDYAEFCKLLSADPNEVVRKLSVERKNHNALTSEIDPESSHDAELHFWIDHHSGVMPDHHPGPVTKEEIAAAHRQIREKLMDRFEHLERGFRMIDADKSGNLGQKEMLRVLMMFNLHKINAKVLDELIKLADSDKDGKIQYSEFCLLVTMPTAQLMKRIKQM